MQQISVVDSRTLRRDNWWIEMLPTWILLGGFMIYGLWTAFNDTNYFADPYLSPFYSPCLAANCEETTIELIGSWWTLTPALLILPIPLGFRTTCYYYRKAYYRAFFGSPPACAVRDVPKRYRGETRFPFILQNIHRYFFWLSLPVLFFLWWDAFKAFDFPDGFGMGVGTVVLLVNAALLTSYSLSCHSCRHLCGGTLDVLSKAPLRQRAWQFVSRFNAHHGKIAWVSLVGVAATDMYVRLVATDAIRDLRFF
jgi:hypothetical protein